MKRRIAGVATIIVATTFALTGCLYTEPTAEIGTPAPLPPPSDVEERTSDYSPGEVNSFEYELPNGDKVFCIFAENYSENGSGLWCTPDFDGKR